MAGGFVNLSIKDSSGATRNVQFWSSDGTVSGTLTPAHTQLGDDANPIVGTKADAAWDGAAGSPTWTALWKYIAVKLGVIATVSGAGSVGTDYSENKPAVPNVGAAFGATGPYANYALIGTIPANPNRSYVEVQNTSGAPIVLIRDDGTAAGGAAPAQASVIPLDGGAATNRQGGSWASRTFRGRIQIYAPAGTPPITAFED
jgi:hypothetical protein